MTGESEVWNDRFAPVASTLSFIRAPLEETAAQLQRWRRELHGVAEQENLEGGLGDNLRSLEPFTVGYFPRELLVSTSNPEWTALFDSMVPSSNPYPRARVLARRFRVDGVGMTAVPDIGSGAGARPRFGARRIEFYGHDRNGTFTSRVLAAVNDGGRWEFHQFGDVKGFEQSEAYERRRVAERLTNAMLVDYAAAVGLSPFEESFYRGPSILITSAQPGPPEPKTMTLNEARAEIGLGPWSFGG